MLENADEDMDEAGHQILMCNEEGETQLVESNIEKEEANIEIDCWIYDLLNILENTDNAMN